MRLLIHVEGQTEETFVREVLAPHLLAREFHYVAPRIVGNPRQRLRGGIRAWPSMRRDVIHHLREDPNCIATTMVDYYGLPKDDDAAWPGRSMASRLPLAQRANAVEAAIYQDIQSHIVRPHRFIPFVLMHEFEALLFSDCERLCHGIDRADLRPQFEAVRQQFATPEDINDSPDSAPSKRIAKILPIYQKPLYGNLAILEIGLATIRQECPHFHQWLSTLEARPGLATA